MTSTQSHISNVNVTVHTYSKSCLSQVLTVKLDLGNISHNCCQWPMGVSWPWPKVMFTVDIYRKSVSGQWLLTAKLDLDNISHTCCQWPKGVSWPWPMVIYLRSKSQCAHTVRAITPHCQVGSWWYFTQLLSMTQECVMTLTQGHISKVKVLVDTLQNSLPGP